MACRYLKNKGPNYAKNKKPVLPGLSFKVIIV